MIEIRGQLTGQIIFRSEAKSLERADLEGATLQRKNLRAADLTGANRVSARMDGADLEGIRLTGALYDSSTRWPAGFDPEAHGAIRLRGVIRMQPPAPADDPAAEGARFDAGLPER